MTNDGFLVSPNTAEAQQPVARPIRYFGHRQCVGGQLRRECRRIAIGVHGEGMLGRAMVGLEWWIAPLDHRPRAFGSASEALAQRFGVLMNTSGTNDPANIDRKNGGLVFTRESGLIVDHPDHDRARSVRADQSRQDIYRPRPRSAQSAARPSCDLRIQRPIGRRTASNRPRAGRRGWRSVMVRAGWLSWAKPPSFPPSSPGFEPDGNERPRDRQPADGAEHHALAVRSDPIAIRSGFDGNTSMDPPAARAVFTLPHFQASHTAVPLYAAGGP